MLCSVVKVSTRRIDPDQLTLHADRGSAMTSKSFALLLADLGVTKTHSRPHVSNDNPFSESAFKTLKYRPGFPDRFGSEQDARAHCRRFFDWYNHEHRHGALGLCTPNEVHRGLAVETPNVAPSSSTPRSSPTLNASRGDVRLRRHSRPRSGSTSPRRRSRWQTLLSKLTNGVSQTR